MNLFNQHGNIYDFNKKIARYIFELNDIRKSSFLFLMMQWSYRYIIKFISIDAYQNNKVTYQ